MITMPATLRAILMKTFPTESPKLGNLLLQRKRRQPLRRIRRCVFHLSMCKLILNWRGQQLSQLEHILKRPDSYIGSSETITQQMWTYDANSKRMVQRDVKYVPGFLKIVDEILVNAADNKVCGSWSLFSRNQSWALDQWLEHGHDKSEHRCRREHNFCPQ